MRALIFDRGTSFPWRTDDTRLACKGVIGDASGLAEFGEALWRRMVVAAGVVFERLLENQRL